MKIAIIHVDCCRECPFSEKIDGSLFDCETYKFYCNHLDRSVEALAIDKDCHLEDE